MKDIAIIGYSGRFPGAKNVDLFWRNLCAGRESISFFTEDELRQSGISNKLLLNPDYVKATPILPEEIGLFDADFFGFSAREAAILDPQQRLILQVAWEALEHAGYATNTRAQNIGIFAGSGGVVSSYLLDYFFTDPMVRGATGSFEHLANDKDFIATRISHKLNLTGPSMAIQTACSTSLLTVHEACLSLADHECDMALAGGINVRIPWMSGYLRHEGDVYSHDGHIRTFDAEATGIVFGSGIGLVMLKRLEDALADRDSIYALIKGSAVNNDGGEKLSYTASSSHGQVACIRKAFEKTGINPLSLSYIEAHGTGTVMGDPVEVSALSQVFKEYDWQPQSCSIGSVKSNVGHLDTAAGVTSLIKCLKMIEDRKIPPQINLNRLNPKIDFENSPFLINRELRSLGDGKTPLRIGINSLGIGGTNVFMILEEPPPLSAAEKEPEGKLILNLSARNEKSLENLQTAFVEKLNNTEDTELKNVCYTSNTGRGQFEYRVNLIADNPKELREKLQSLNLKDNDSKTILPRGFIFKPVFHLGNLSSKTLTALKKCREDNPLYNSLVTKVAQDLSALSSAQDLDYFSLIAGQLLFWKELGLQSKAMTLSLRHLPIAAYVLGYLEISDSVELFHRAKDNNLSAFLASLKKCLHLKSYQTELLLLPYCVDLIELLSSEQSPPSRSDGLSFDQYCAQEEFTELFRLENESELKTALIIHSADEDLLSLLSYYYRKGAMINWNSYYSKAQYKKIPLPTYPFNLESYWMGRKKQLRTREISCYWGATPVHLTEVKEKMYQLSLSIQEYPLLGYHYFFEYPMVAASALISWILEVAALYYNITSCRIDEFMFMQALMLPSNENLEIQLVVKPMGNDQYRFVIRSFHEAFLIQDQKWIEHVVGVFSKNAQSAVPRFEGNEIPQGETLSFDKKEIYAKLRKRGLILTRAYECIDFLVKNKTEALAKLGVRFLHKEDFQWQYHPGILDALFQVVQCLLSESIDPKAIFLLSQWQSMTFYKECQSPEYIHVKVLEQDEGRSLLADVKLLDDKKQILASVSSVRIGKASQMVATAEMLHYKAWQYHFNWLELTPPEERSDKLRGKVMIFGDESGASEGLMDLFSKNDIQAQCLAYRDFSKEKFSELDSDINAIIYLWPIDSDDLVSAQSNAEDLDKICGSLLLITQKYFNTKAPIFIITRGAIATLHALSHINPLQGALWGAGRSIAVERGLSSCVLIDLDPDAPIGPQISQLNELITHCPEEQQLALRKGKVFVPRLDYYAEAPSPLLDINFIKPFSIFQKADSNKEWLIQILPEEAPKDTEVQIEILASGLAYRDYLSHLGMTQEKHIGDDFAGRVIALGEKVLDFQVGDLVFGLLQGTLRSPVNMGTSYIQKLPAHIHLDQAALWPLVYLTASYALERIAKLTEKKTLLITGASSGVGFAALQIAKRLKLNTIAAVNGADKEHFLQTLGFNAVINISDPSWKNSLAQRLGTSRIDAVLAGTHKEVTEAASDFFTQETVILDLSGGRLEYLADIKNHKGFCPIHMYEIIRDDLTFIKKAFSDLKDYFESPDFQGMLYRPYSLNRLQDAFQALANPHRMNKIVLNFTEETKVLFKSDASYMVVGGLGALGAFFIPWLLRGGAGSICLVDIAEKTDKLELTLKQKFGKQANIHYYACDITNSEAVKELFRKISADGHSLKGIFNIATMLQDAPIPKQGLPELHRILQVKSVGSQNLHLNSIYYDLDFFVMFSSIASLMGSQNQFNYAAANSYQDALAQHRYQLGLPALAINWSPWQVGVGAYMGANAAKVFESWGSHMLDPKHDLESLKYLLRLPIPEIALFAIDWGKFIRQFEIVPAYLKGLEARFVQGTSLDEGPENSFLLELASIGKSEAKETVSEFLREEISACLQITKDQVGLNDPFSNFGIDSMMAITVRDHLQKKLGRELPAMILYSHPSIDHMAGFIVEKLIDFSAEGTALGTKKEAEEKVEGDVDTFLDSLLDEDKEKKDDGSK